jgi:protease IV
MHNQQNTPEIIHETQAQYVLPEKTKQPMSGMRHFALSFLAVITGIPVSFIIVSTIFTVFVLFLAVIFGGGSSESSSTLLSMQTVSGSETARNTLAAVPIRGVILSGTAADPLQSLFGQTYADGELIKEQLYALAKDKTVDGVVLEIDSPGGMITASKAIADGIKYYKETTNKPVISHINGTGASGAYWAAAATDKIYAEQGSEIGSIGVIFGPLVTLNSVVGYEGITTKDPITFKYFTAGRSKDLGSPFRALTPEEEVFLNQEIQNEYVRFVAHVSDSRAVPAETITGDIGALAYGTTSAQAKNLIDGEMSKEQAYQSLADMARIGSDYNVKRVNNAGTFFGGLFGAQSKIFSKTMSSSEKADGRKRFCNANLVGKPLVLSGEVSAVCE